MQKHYYLPTFRARVEIIFPLAEITHQALKAQVQPR